MGHFYDKEGNPQHFVQGKNGEMRDATLRDARKHGWVPGFSGVTSIMARPGLDKWKENQILEAAWIAEIPPSDEDTDRYGLWKTYVKRIANEQSLKARDRGSEIHDYIERFIKRGFEDIDPTDKMFKYVDAVALAVQDQLGLNLRSLEAETTFSSSLGYGGAVDGLLRSQDYSSKPIEAFGLLLDWKTTQTALADKKKLTYQEHVMQLAAYRDGVKLPNAICANVFIGPDAEVKIHIWPEDELQAAFEKFKICLELWKLDRNYRSEWEE